MPTIQDSDLASRHRRSLERSRERRAHTRRRRLRSFRTRTTAIVAAATLTLGAGAAMGGQGLSSGGSGSYLSAGSGGSSVSAVQRALGISVTGTFDSRTDRAVRSFQRRNGLAVDGIVGPQTRAALGLGGGGSGSAGSGSGSSVEGGSSSGGSASGGSTSGAGSGTLARIAQCESGGDPSAVSGNGQYRGKYQFDRSTWQSLGGSGDPAAASEAEQDRIAAKLLARSGTAPWANCAG